MSLELKHLNADSSWLLTLGKTRILIDPWLFGPQTDYFSWFSTQEHVVRSSVENVEEELKTKIDAILISHEFTDHCHEATLKSLSRQTPIFATKNALNKIRQWNFFEKTGEIRNLTEPIENFCFDSDRSISVGYLPEKGFLGLPSLHGALCIAFRVDENFWNCLLYVAHGCRLESIELWFRSNPNVRCVALLHGFEKISNPFWLGGLLNYGFRSASEIVVALRIPIWISTHDENKKATGLVSKFLQRDNATIFQVNEYFQNVSNRSSTTKIVQIPNGESICLELRKEIQFESFSSN